MAGLGTASSLNVNGCGVLSGICDQNEIWSGGVEVRHRRHKDHHRIPLRGQIENDIHHRESIRRRWA